MITIVTGAAGFIGSHLCDALISRGDQVIGIDDYSTGRKTNLAHLESNPRFTCLTADITNPAALAEVAPTAHRIFHLAAAVGVQYVMAHPVKSVKENVLGALNVLQYSKDFRIPLFLASSSEVYGVGNQLPLKEEDSLILGAPTTLRWGYGCSKATGEFLAIGHHRQEEVPVVIGRFFNICGTRQVGRYGMVIPRFVKAALTGEPLTIYGDGSQVRSFTSVSDAVRAVLALMEGESHFGEIFNIGNPQPTSILELARQIIKITGSSSQIKLLSFEQVFGSGFSDMAYRVPDISKLKSAIGFTPEIDLRDSLLDIIEYWREQL